MSRPLHVIQVRRLGSWFARSRRAARRRMQDRSRWTIEALEDRVLLSAVAPPSGMVSWWTADNTTVDHVGPNDASLFNGATFSAGKVGQAFSFDGVNDRGQVADHDSLKLTGSMTIEAWVLVDSTTNHGVILFRGDDRGGLDPYSLAIQDGQLWFQISDFTGGTVVKAAIPQGQFTHVAATLDDATGSMRLYVDGALAAQTVTPIRPFRELDPASNPSIGIGNHGGYPSSPHNFPFDGLIDELSVYNRALTPTEIQGIYNAGSDGKIKATNYFTADSPSVGEGAAGSSSVVTFTIQRAGDLAGQAIVNWTTADGSASAGADYQAASGQLVFSDGESQKTVEITVNGDDAAESHETFQLVLSTPTAGYGVGGGQATIVDDEPPTISVGNAAAIEGSGEMKLIDVFIAPQSGGLRNARGIDYGPDGNLYISSDNTGDPNLQGWVNRYDAATGRFIDRFASHPDMTGAKDVEFGPDGHLYVPDNVGDNVYRFNGTTGEFIDVFIPAGSGGLDTPRNLIFGHDGNDDGNQDIYITSRDTDSILRFDGVTGAFIDAFVSSGSGGLNNPTAVVFGPDGDLFVASGAHEDFHNSILRYDGTTGAFLGVFVPEGSGGLTLAPNAGVIFGPDVNGDGRPDLYVSNSEVDEVLLYDGGSGAFLGPFVTAGLGGLDFPMGLRFDGDGNLLVVGGADHNVLRFGAASQAAFAVTLSRPSEQPVTVSYSTANGTAEAGSDYVAASGTITFQPGETTRTILVPTINDGVAEPNETFTVNLAGPTNATISDATGVATISDDDIPTKFYVVDAAADRTFEYAADFQALESYGLASGSFDPRGVASDASGSRVWVIDNNDHVSVYDPDGTLLGSWQASGLNTPEGIASNGTDLWIVDRGADRVYRFAGAASRLSGTISATSSFALNKQNTQATGIETDGTHLWIVDDGTQNRVFKYTLAGSLLGNWKIDNANTAPSGITLDPSNPSDVWIVDPLADKIFQYTAAANRTSGSQSAAASFNLAPGNTDPHGIADPPVAGVPDVAAELPASADGNVAAVAESTRLSAVSGSQHRSQSRAVNEPVPAHWLWTEAWFNREAEEPSRSLDEAEPGVGPASNPLLTSDEADHAFADFGTELLDELLAIG